MWHERPAPLFAFVYGAAALVMIAAVAIDGSGGLRAPWILVVVVVVVGFWQFGVHLTPSRLAGLAMCVAGAGLVAR